MAGDSGMDGNSGETVGDGTNGVPPSGKVSEEVADTSSGLVGTGASASQRDR